MQQPPSYQTSEDEEFSVAPAYTEQQSAQTPQEVTDSVVRTARAVRRRPIVRYLGIALLVSVAVVLVTVGIFTIQKAQRSAPTNVEAYPGARVISERKTANSDETVYAVNDVIDKVGAFYTNQFNSDSGMCQRLLPPKGDPVPSYKCALDTSMLDALQIATVTITYDAKTNTTKIVVNRSWNGGK